MNRFTAILLSFIFVLGMSHDALSHGDLHDQILDSTQKIKTDPKNAVLYHKRGELHRAHGSYPEALLDYAEAEKLDPKLDVVLLSRGRALQESSKFQEALHELNAFLIRQPKHNQARWLRGQVFARLNMRGHADIDFRLVLESTAEPSPDQYIECAQNLEKWGDHKKAAALQVVQDGIKKLGPLITLELAALDLELALKDYKAAHQRIDILLANAARKETYLVRKAEIFEQMGDKENARKTYQKALETIEALSPRQRKTKSVVQLETKIRGRLQP